MRPVCLIVLLALGGCAAPAHTLRAGDDAVARQLVVGHTGTVVLVGGEARPATFVRLDADSVAWAEPGVPGVRVASRATVRRLTVRRRDLAMRRALGQGALIGAAVGGVLGFVLGASATPPPAGEQIGAGVAIGAVGAAGGMLPGALWGTFAGATSPAERTVEVRTAPRAGRP